MNYMDTAKKLISEFKGNTYAYGRGILNQVGRIAAGVGDKALLIATGFPGSDSFVRTIEQSLVAAGVQVLGHVSGAQPNAPREDLTRIVEAVKQANPNVLVSFGGGSTIDAVKAAEVLRTLGGKIDDYFGVGQVTEARAKSNAHLTPHIAIQTAASSGAHLTKYSNITDTKLGQKKLIVDESIVPSNPVFDFSATDGAPAALTMDGALDGISHCLEVLYGAAGTPNYASIREVARTGISLVVEHLPRVIATPEDSASRDAICVATDMGAYAIMLGGTNGGHLTSFSLVDVLSHGRACAILNPYYSVFFAPAVEDALRTVGRIYFEAGLTDDDPDRLSGRTLGESVAESMFELARRVGFPTKLADVPGFTDEHISRALEAAKNPQLEMKLKNMPVAMDASMIDEYMRPILEGARDGDLSRIKLPA